MKAKSQGIASDQIIFGPHRQAKVLPFRVDTDQGWALSFSIPVAGDL
jgi:hypothetical protein